MAEVDSEADSGDLFGDESDVSSAASDFAAPAIVEADGAPEMIEVEASDAVSVAPDGAAKSSSSKSSSSKCFNSFWSCLIIVFNSFW